MKQLVLYIVFMAFSFSGKTHSDLSFDLGEEELTFIVGTGFQENEFSQQGFILSALCRDYLNQTYKGNPHPRIFISLFESYYSKENSGTIFLGIDSIQLTEQGYSLRNIKSKSGQLEEAIIIYIDARIIKGKTIFSLLDYGLNNRDAILSSQRDTTYINEKLKTIPTTEINKILSSENQKVRDILSRKYWRYRNYYFYQNDQFHFPLHNDSTKVKLKLEHVFQIIEFYNQGLVVFDSDSSFYFLPTRKSEIMGPYRINNVRKQRIPLFKDAGEIRYIHDTYSSTLDRFIMEIEVESTDAWRRQTVLFLPQFDTIIQNYGSIEKDLILDQLGIENDTGKFIWNNSILALLIISIFFNWFLLWRIRKSTYHG